MENSWLYYIILTFLFLISVSKLFILHNKQKKNKNLAPSPPSIPIIGHLHLLNKGPPYKTLQQLSLKYGPIFSLRFGFRSVIVVSSPSAVEECFTKNDLNFANRPRFLSGKHLNYNFTTVGAAPYGTLWKNLRRFTAMEIFSKARLNESLGVRKEEIKLLIKDLSNKSSLSQDFAVKVEMKSKLSELSFNIVMRIVAGKRYFGDQVENYEEARNFRELIRGVAYLSGASNADFLPFLIDYEGLEKRMMGLQREFDAFIQGLIDEHKKKICSSNDIIGRKTVIESMLELQQSEPEFYSDEIIKGIILVLLLAGTDTTAVTMEWAMDLLLNHPNVLKKARAELDYHVGHNCLVEEPDLSKLPYLQGIVNEALRLYPAVPLLVPRESSNDCTIGRFDVPSKTMLLVNAWSIHRDPKLWDDPESFKPERYDGLEDEAYKLKLIPFGLGRRRCPGAGLANREVALALASLIQCFEWERIDEELVNMDEGMGLSMPKAKPLEAMCRVREEMREVILEL
ncbi:hypothetical protein RD792_012434 [Penstemon davidsonii]|uniref:Cytochrome P450 n=1 Tax=Penstemon davidsonii TaxID=160366 RepID=A0ABR0CWV5_9LAMI|nr:hypothetical protein RD792_012434 [Penstemon davidsonii]